MLKPGLTVKVKDGARQGMVGKITKELDFNPEWDEDYEWEVDFGRGDTCKFWTDELEEWERKA